MFTRGAVKEIWFEEDFATNHTTRSQKIVLEAIMENLGCEGSTNREALVLTWARGGMLSLIVAQYIASRVPRVRHSG